jgi:hypothetical protein
MGKFKLAISVSLDGFVAGPNQSVDERASTSREDRDGLVRSE